MVMYSPGAKRFSSFGENTKPCMDSFCIAKGDITKEFFQCNLQRFVIILYTFKQVLKKTGFQSKDFSAEFKILLFYLTRLHAYRQAGGNDSCLLYTSRCV